MRRMSEGWGRKRTNKLIKKIHRKKKINEQEPILLAEISKLNYGITNAMREPQPKGWFEHGVGKK